MNQAFSMTRAELRDDELAVPTLTHLQPSGEARPRRAQVIAVTSGKGGVGKTVVSTNLAIELAAQGHKVCIFDADTGLANINIVLGIQPAYTLEHLLSGEKPLDELLVEGPRGVSILPAASGITDCVNLNQNQRGLLIDALRTLESRFDYLLIDTGAGIDETVLQFVRAAHHAVVVISPEPTSLTDAFALIKVLVRSGHTSPIHIVINKVANSKVSHGVFERFRDVIRTYLNFTVGYLGFVIVDNAVKTSIIEQSPVVTLLPESVAARCFNALATQIPKLITQDPQASDFAAYWQQQMEDAGPADSGAVSAQDALQMLRDHLQSAELDGAAARALVEPLIHDFIEHYVDFPFDVREALYTTLEMENFPKLQLLELITNLEAVYHRRHHDSLRSAQDLLVQLLASAADDELAWKTLARQLQLSFKRRFNKDLF